jgi:hypothetical protein
VKRTSLTSTTFKTHHRYTTLVTAIALYTTSHGLPQRTLPYHRSTNKPSSIAINPHSPPVLQAMPHIPHPLGHNHYHRLLLFLLVLLLLNRSALAVYGSQNPNTLITLPIPSDPSPGSPSSTVPSPQCNCEMIRRTINLVPMQHDSRDWCIWRWGWY